MGYPEVNDLQELMRQIKLYAQLKTEYGAQGIPEILSYTKEMLQSSLLQLKALPINEELAKLEPNDLAEIKALRPEGPRRLQSRFNKVDYLARLEGALLGRMAGCTLGAPVELWTVERMKALADENGDTFPPTDYWSRVPESKQIRYEMSLREVYTRSGLDGVPVDDDIVYTLLGLLIVEDYGFDFTTEDVGNAWLKYLPYACTAEEITLQNLKNGLPAEIAGSTNNPYCEWIGASIRADPWGYMAPGLPERAAEMAYRDAYLSHRRQGIYGEMFFAAAISAAFVLDDPVEALRIGLTEIPRDCALAEAIRWALDVSPKIKDYQMARAAVDSRFEGMDRVHTINNACLTVFGITIGGMDFTRVIGETVAMGLDNDCTAATAGSIVGAVIGKDGIPARWYKNFNDTIYSYVFGMEKFSLADVLKRFERQAVIVCRQ